MLDVSNNSDGGDIVSEFLESVKTFLEEGNCECVLCAFNDKKYERLIENNSCELVPAIAKFLTHKVLDEQPDVFKCSQVLLNIIAENSNPEDVLLQIIEEIEETSDDDKFLSLLKPTHVALKRIPYRRINSFAWSFNAIQSYIKNLPPPGNYNLSNEERLLLDCDDNFNRITFVYFEIISFYHRLIVELQCCEEFNEEFRKMITKFLIQLLAKPLCHLDLGSYGKSVGRGRTIAEKIISLVFHLRKDPYIFLEDSISNNEFEKPSDLGLGVFYYLIFETNDKQMIPKVYSSVYLFHMSLKLVTELLIQETQLCVEKGFTLMGSNLNKIDRCSLSYLLLESSEHSRFCRQICNVIIFNQAKEVRKNALSILQRYLYSFEIHGRYLIIYNLVNILNHTSLIGFLITTYKEMLAHELQNEKYLPIYFRNEKLRNILSIFCLLPNKEESDLVELADKIIASLNLLRYLVLCDKNNVTNIREYIPNLQRDYLDTLKKAILLSRAHYELKIKEIESENINNVKEPLEVEVSASGQTLSDLTSEEKIRILMLSLTTLDVIDSLLCRLNECIEII